MNDSDPVIELEGQGLPVDGQTTVMKVHYYVISGDVHDEHPVEIFRLDVPKYLNYGKREEFVICLAADLDPYKLFPYQLGPDPAIESDEPKPKHVLWKIVSSTQATIDRSQYNRDYVIRYHSFRVCSYFLKLDPALAMDNYYRESRKDADAKDWIYIVSCFSYDHEDDFLPNPSIFLTADRDHAYRTFRDEMNRLREDECEYPSSFTCRQVSCYYPSSGVERGCRRPEGVSLGKAKLSNLGRTMAFDAS
jgi:hypothetical protein